MHLYLQGSPYWKNSPCKLIVLKIGCAHIFIIHIFILMRQRGWVRPTCQSLASCWISSQLSRVQILSHTCKIANWFASIIVYCTVSTTTAVFSVITCSRLLFLTQLMDTLYSTCPHFVQLLQKACFSTHAVYLYSLYNETILYQADSHLANKHREYPHWACEPKLQTHMYPQGSSWWKYMYGSCKLTVSISSLRNNWLDWWTPCTAPALILFAASFPMNTRRLAWLNQALSCTSSGVMVCWRVFVSAERVFPTEFPSKNSDKGKQ